MIPAGELIDELKSQGAGIVTGVPCSIFKRLINELEQCPDLEYLPAPREDSAIGIAAGVWLGGVMPVVVMQNSGLGTAWTALASLNMIYDIPALILISWRGFGGLDAPEHLVMGREMTTLLESLGVGFEVITEEHWRLQLANAFKSAQSSAKPFALLIKEGIL